MFWDKDICFCKRNRLKQKNSRIINDQITSNNKGLILKCTLATTTHDILYLRKYKTSEKEGNTVARRAVFINVQQSRRWNNPVFVFVVATTLCYSFGA